MRSNEIKNEIKKILKKWEGKSNKKILKHETKKYLYGFQQYETIRFFLEVFALVKQKYFKLRRIKAIYSKNIVEFKTKSGPRTKKGKYKKKDTYECAFALYEGR